MNTQNSNPPSQDFAKLVDLQSKFSEATNKLTALEAAINAGAQSSALQSAEEYVVIQESVALLESEIVSLYAKHPEWRGDKKSISTPYGSVEQRTVTELLVLNPALTVTLIETRAQNDPKFVAADYLHITKKPDLEALEGLGNDDLSALGITRQTTECITVKPAKLSVAKIVKAAAKQKVK